jgi:methionyl-tRNA synthetase
LPTKIIDKYYHINNKSLRKFGVNFDFFSRTSSQIHKKIVQNFFMKLYNKNIFEVHENKQFYDTIYKQFLPDRYLIGTCSKCNHKKAYGDQCESCLANLNGSDLINPVSILSNKKPILKKTKHWYLPLYKYEKWLQNWLFNTKKKWKLNVYGQCRSWINQGLKSRSITRDLNWGIKLPLKKEEKKVLYVWFDAPIGYISGSQEWAKKIQYKLEVFLEKKKY